MPSTSKLHHPKVTNADRLIDYRGVEPLTGDDIAEVVVFAASRRENVVIADTLIFPSHQVSSSFPGLVMNFMLTSHRPVLVPCTASPKRQLNNTNLEGLDSIYCTYPQCRIGGVNPGI